MPYVRRSVHIRPQQIGYKLVFDQKLPVEFISVDKGTTLKQLMDELQEQNAKANRSFTYHIEKNKALWQLSYGDHMISGYANRAQERRYA